MLVESSKLYQNTEHVGFFALRRRKTYKYDSSVDITTDQGVASHPVPFTYVYIVVVMVPKVLVKVLRRDHRPYVSGII